MMEERQGADIPPGQAQPRADGFTPEIGEKLADLALLSERQGDLSLALGEAHQMLASLVERHPEFRGASSELLTKLDQLARLQATLSTAVMRYSHLYEDANVGTP